MFAHFRAPPDPEGIPVEFVMLGLIALLIFFMFRNGKKRQQAMQELRSGVVPGAEVILQPGIFATVEEIDEEQDRLTVRSGSSTFVVHRNMVAQLTPTFSETEESGPVAPDDDPAFGSRLAEPQNGIGEASAPIEPEQTDEDTRNARPDSDQGDTPGENRPA